MALYHPSTGRTVEGITNPDVVDMLVNAGWIDDEEELEVEDLTATAAPSASSDDSDELTTPAGNASRDEWSAFAGTLGIEVPDGAKRDEIRALVEQLLNDEEHEV